MFFMTLFANPLFRKIAIYAAIAGGVFLMIRWYGNRQYDIGKVAGAQQEAKLIVAAKQEEWKLREAELQKRSEALTAEEKKRAAVDMELRRMRASMEESLAKIQIQNQASNQGAGTIVAAIPGDQLDASIRAKSAELGPPAKTIK